VRTHGCDGTYSVGCRCDDCKRAHALAAYQARRRRVVTDFAMHGKASTYKNYMCRCDLCREAVRLERRRAS
jgi:hypothetical protein